MSNYVVTIARQYGSGGREVGLILSERTGLKFYDKDLITMAAQKSGMSSEALQKADEKAANSLLYTLALGSSIYNHGVEHVNLPINDRLFVVQSEIIKDLASSGLTMLVVTHEMGFARDVCDRVVFMDGGVIVESNVPEVIFTNPEQPRTREFLARILEN